MGWKASFAPHWRALAYPEHEASSWKSEFLQAHRDLGTETKPAPVPTQHRYFRTWLMALTGNTLSCQEPSQGDTARKPCHSREMLSERCSGSTTCQEKGQARPRPTWLTVGGMARRQGLRLPHGHRHPGAALGAGDIRNPEGTQSGLGAEGPWLLSGC